MRTKLTIKNFRVFDADGDTIELAPITVLTGCNSSGKSSVVKAFMMLNEFLKQFKNSLSKGEAPMWRVYKIDFRKHPFNLLGRFDKIVNRQSDDHRITLEYTVNSKNIQKDVKVSFVFAADDRDVLNNAYLDQLTISTDDGVVLQFDRHDKNGILNLSIIKDVCLDALYAQYSQNFDDESIRNCELIEWSRQNHSLFEIPIVDHISLIPKDKLLEHVANEYKVSDEHLSLAIHKIINDFVESEYSTFAEYYRHYEHEYLNNAYDAICGHFFDLELTIQQFYLRFFEDFDEEVGAVVDRSEEQLKRPIDFDILFEVIMFWNHKLYPCAEIKKSNIDGHYQHRILELMSNFVSDFLKEVLCPDWCGNMDYSSSSRVAVQRIYSLEDRDGLFADVLKRRYENIRIRERRVGNIRGSGYYVVLTSSGCSPSYNVDSFINKWIKEFGIGESISMEMDSEGVGLKIWINKANGEKNLLADEGYGITQLVAILLQVENAIIERDLEADENHSITVAIEEPEIHLHPAYQSKLTDMFADACLTYNIHFIVETHSEYLIRKLQVMVADERYRIRGIHPLTSNYISLNYVDRGEDGVARNKKIGIAEDGSLIDEFGEGFYDEADNLAMELFRKKPILS